MPRPPVHDVSKILASDEARRWLEQLVPVFRNSEGKTAVLGEVRARIPELTPGLPGDALRKLTGAVIQELCREASRRIPPELPGPAEPPLSRRELHQRVTSQYPYPIATAYDAFQNAEGAAEEFGCLLTVFEALVHYLAAVVVSAYLRTDLASAACNQHLVSVFLKGKWTLGTLYALFRDTLRHARGCDDWLPYPAARDYLFDGDDALTPQGQDLETFIELRNAELGHGGNRTSEYFAPLVEANAPRLQRHLARMTWLADWQLIRPVVIDRGRVTRADLLVGFNRYKNEPFELALRERDLDPQAGDVHPDRESLVLVAPDRSRHLLLFPVAQYRVGLQAAYLLSGLAWAAPPPPGRLKKASYLAYQEREPHREEAPPELAISSLERLLNRLLAHAPAADVAAAPPAASAPEADPDFTISGVADEQQSHLRAFAGRENLIGEIDAWLEDPGKEGYLLLLGPPGQGKSALMAQLAQRKGSKGGCLLHMVKSHSQPSRFLPALISQAAKLTGSVFGPEAYRGSLDDLRESLVKALKTVLETAGRAVLVIDALDELELAEERIRFLPPHLPEGVRVVMTSRPDRPLVTALRAHLRGSLAERDVPPLSAGDFRLLLQRRLPEELGRALLPTLDLDALLQRLGGNALFVSLFVEDLPHRHAEADRAGRELRINPDEVPAGPEAVFRTVYDRVRGRSLAGHIPTEGRQRARVLQLLCVAMEGLEIEALSGLMAAWGEPLFLDECRDLIEEMSQWLLEIGPGCFKPWHQGLSDHVRYRELGEAGVQQVQEMYCKWLRSGGGKYGLRYRVKHLLAARRYDEVIEVLTDLAYLETRTEAGFVFELLADFSQAVSVVPRTHPNWESLHLLEEALRRDVHFVDRHPNTLFQCLRNLSWWSAAEGLKAVVSSWQAAKLALGVPWLRSLLPPEVALGTSSGAILRRHRGAVLCASYSPDGTCVAAGSGDGAVRVWDVRTGKQVGLLRGPESGTPETWVNDVAFSRDGRFIASGSSDGRIQLWELRGDQGPEYADNYASLGDHSAWVEGVGFAPDSQVLAAASFDNAVHLWDVHRKVEFARLTGHEGWVSTVSFCPTGDRLASASDDATVRLWDVRGRKELLCIRGHNDMVFGVAFSPDGRHIASASFDSTVRVWDAATGRQVVCLREHDQAVWRVAYSPDGRYLASASFDGTVRIWATRDWTEEACFHDHENWVNCVSFSPDGRFLVSASDDGTVRVRDLKDRGARPTLLRRDDRVEQLTFSADGSRLVAITSAGQALVWRTETGERVPDGVQALESPEHRRPPPFAVSGGPRGDRDGHQGRGDGGAPGVAPVRPHEPHGISVRMLLGGGRE